MLSKSELIETIDRFSAPERVLENAEGHTSGGHYQMTTFAPFQLK